MPASRAVLADIAAAGAQHWQRHYVLAEDGHLAFASKQVPQLEPSLSVEGLAQAEAIVEPLVEVPAVEQTQAELVVEMSPPAEAQQVEQAPEPKKDPFAKRREALKQKKEKAAQAAADESAA